MSRFLVFVAVALCVVAAAASVVAAAPSTSSDAPCAANDERCIVRRARRLQFDLDALDRRKQRERAALERRYRHFISRTVFERNELLRAVPAFWYYALRGFPHSHTFMSPKYVAVANAAAAGTGATAAAPPVAAAAPAAVVPPREPYCGIAAQDQCVADDHDALRLFLRNVRCFRVHPTPPAATAAGWTSHERSLRQQVAVEGLREAPPRDAMSASRRDDAEGELRVEVEFESNNAFQQRKLFRQVPAHFRTEQFVAEVDDALPDGGAVRAHFGIGTALRWSGAAAAREALLGLRPGEPHQLRTVSFFSFFDQATLAAAALPENEQFRRALQHGLSTLVRAVCDQLEPNPLPLFERERGEEALAAELDRIQRGGAAHAAAAAAEHDEEYEMLVRSMLDRAAKAKAADAAAAAAAADAAAQAATSDL